MTWFLLGTAQVTSSVFTSDSGMCVGGKLFWQRSLHPTRARGNRVCAKCPSYGGVFRVS